MTSWVRRKRGAIVETVLGILTFLFGAPLCLNTVYWLSFLLLFLGISLAIHGGIRLHRFWSIEAEQHKSRTD